MDCLTASAVKFPEHTCYGSRLPLITRPSTIINPFTLHHTRFPTLSFGRGWRSAPGSKSIFWNNRPANFVAESEYQ